MAVVEDLIVAMGFDNKQFEAAVKISMATLGQLKSQMNFGGGKNGIDSMQASANNFNMSGIGTATDGVSAKFLAMSTVAITALSNIVNKAVDAGLNVAKAFTVAPIAEGFQEYETKIGSIQTILSNTAQDYGGNEDAALADITKNLEELNQYADLTIYNFADMTKNIGLFTNAGIDVQSATKMIQGFSNEAAASGTSAEKAAGAAQQLSQGLSTGVITAQDWMSITTAGMGSSNMRDGIVQIAEAMGAFEGKGITAAEAAKDFKGSLEKKWLSADVMENYLNIQAEGESAVNKLVAEGIELTDEQQKRFIDRQKMSQDAAQEVRTFTQLMGTLKEGVGSSWAKTTEILLGDFKGATTLFSGIYNTLSPMLGAFGDSRNELLQSWADMGGRDSLLAGLKNVFDGLLSVIRPIGDAFRQIFPPTTAATLLSLTQSFERFSQKLIVGGETADKLKRTFAGVFAIFGIGWEVVKGIFGVFADLFGAVSGGSGGFLSLTATIGDWVVKVHEAIKNGEIFKNIFSVLGTILKAPIALLSNMGTAIGEILGGLSGGIGSLQQFMDILFKGDFTGGPLAEDSPVVDTLFKIREGFETAASVVSQFWNILSKGDFVAGFFEEDSPIVEWLFNIRDSISKFFSSDGLKLILGGAAGVGLGVAVKNMIQKAFKFGSDDGDSFFGTIKDAFGSVRDAFDNVGGLLDQVTGSFKAMQQNLQAGTLLKIGAAIGIVALSLKLLSTIDGKQMAISLAGVGTAMGILMAGMTIMTKIAGSGGMVAMPAIAIGLMGLATAILILTAAVKVLSTMSWDELLRGMAGLAMIMAVIVAAAYGLSKAEGQLIRAGIAMIPLAVAIRLLVGAVAQLSQLSWTELAKGVGSITILITGLGLALKLMPNNMVSIGVGLLAIGAGMLLLTQSVEKIGNMDIETLRQGIIGMSVALGGIAIAMQAMPKNMPAIALGLAIVAGALMGVTAVIVALGGMSPESMAQGIIALGSAMGILALGLNLMTGTLSGSAAIAVAAIGLALLLPSILALSMLSWGQLLIGMAGLAATLGILGVAGMLLTPVVPTLVALGVALGLMGIGLIAVATAALIFSTALTALVAIAAGGQAALVNLAAIIPQMAAAFGGAIIAFVTTIASKAGELTAAVAQLVGAMLDAFLMIIPKLKDVVLKLITAIVEIIVTAAPQIGEAVTALITMFLSVITTNVPNIVNAALELITSFLTSIRDNIGQIVTIAGEIITNFINALAGQLPSIIQSGFNLIISFMEGLAQAIRDNSQRMADAGLDIAEALVDGIVNGLGSMIGRVASAAGDLARGAIDAVTGIFEIRSPSRVFRRIGEYTAEGLVQGIDNGQGDVAQAGANMAGGLLGSVTDGLRDLGKVANSVWGIVAQGDFIGNGGILEEDSPIVDTLFNIREGLLGLGGAAQETWNILTQGDFKGVGPWEEDSPIVSTLFEARAGFQDLGGAAQQTWDILTQGDFKSGGPWEEDSTIVSTLFDIREGMEDVGGAAKQAWDILNEGDFKGDGPWDEDSPIVSTLFDIREGFEEFHGVGENAIQGLIDGFVTGQADIAKAAEDMANAALASARAALGIQSPSKEFRTIGEYSIDGLISGLKAGEEKINGQGKTVANGLVNGFSKGLGKELPKAFASIFETLKTGTADAKFWGPNSPITQQLQGLSEGLRQADLQLAAFYGEVNMADPASIQAYAEKTGNSLKYLTGLLNGMEKAANTAFEMLESGKGLDVVLGDEAVLNNLVDGILSVIPGVEAMLVRLGLAVVDGLLGIFFNTSVMGIVGKFITWAVRQIGAIFGIEFPIEEELDDADKKLRDFLVTVEDTKGRFEKLSEAGIAAIADTITEANEAVDEIDRDPVITPILDLTEYNKAKGGMEADIPTGLIPETSSNQANTIYSDRAAQAAAEAEARELAGPTSLEFKQYNNSPVPLSHVEIYKQTKGLLGMAKEALNIK